MEEQVKNYIIKQYIDYGDLNEQAEKQIEKAFIDGWKAALNSEVESIEGKGLPETHCELCHKNMRDACDGGMFIQGVANPLNIHYVCSLDCGNKLLKILGEMNIVAKNLKIIGYENE